MQLHRFTKGVHAVHQNTTLCVKPLYEKKMVVDHYLSILFGIAGGAMASQLPGFTLQYMQNLNGRIDELQPIVAEFEADVAEYNYTITDALVECKSAEGLLDALCDSFEDIILRFEFLLAHFNKLAAASDYARPFVLGKAAHTDIIESVIEEFKPAVPVDASGLVYAGFGFLAFWLFLQLFLCLFCSVCRRRSRRRKKTTEELPMHRAQFM